MRPKALFLLFISLFIFQQSHAQFAWMPKPTHPDMVDFWWLNDQRVAYLEEDYWGLMDASGKAITPPDYLFFKNLEQNLYGFQVPESGLWGVMNADGKVLVEAEYEEIKEAKEGYLRVQRRPTPESMPEYNFLTLTGQLVLPKFYKFLSDVQDGVAVFSEYKLYGFMTPTGVILIQEKFKNAQPFHKGLSAVKNDESKGWGFIDKKGQWVIQPQYALVPEDFKGNLLKIGQNAATGNEVEWGLIDHQGKVILNRSYQIIDPPSENGLMLVKQKELYGFVNGLGQPIAECIYSDASSYTKEGLARVKKDGKWGFINSKGVVVIPFVYDMVDNYSENMAAVQKDSKWGFINTQGLLVIPHKFNAATMFEKGRSSVLTDSEVAVIDKTGNIVLHTGTIGSSYTATSTSLFMGLGEAIVLLDQKGQLVKRLPFEDIGNFTDDLAAVFKDGYYGFINTNGEIVVPLKYFAVLPYNDGLTAVQEMDEEEVYFIDKTGKKAFDMPEGYEYNGSFFEGMASVASNQLGGFIDRKGTLIVPAKYANLADFKNGMAVIVNSEGKQGFIDTKGKEVIPPAYDECGNMSADGLAAVKLNELYGFVNRSGKLVVPAQYEVVTNFVKGVAGVKKDNKVGYIDAKGKEIVPLIFEDGKEFLNDFAAVKSNGKWGFVNLKGKGKLVVEAMYDEVGAFSEGLCWVNKDGKIGCINGKGETVIPFQYQDAGEFKDGLAYVKKDDLYGVVDRTGKDIIPPACTAVSSFSNGRVIAKVPASGFMVFPLK